MISKKIGILAKIILLLIILIPITFRVYNLYYANANWDINSKYISRDEIYRNYNSEKKAYGIPNVYYKYKKLTPEEMMTLEVLANEKGYDVEKIIPNIEKFVLYQHEKNPTSKLTESEKVEVDKYVDQVKLSVENSLEENSTYIFSMKIILSVSTALMVVLSIYAICMMVIFISEK